MNSSVTCAFRKRGLPASAKFTIFSLTVYITVTGGFAVSAAGREPGGGDRERLHQPLHGPPRPRILGRDIRAAHSGASVTQGSAGRRPQGPRRRRRAVYYNRVVVPLTRRVLLDHETSGVRWGHYLLLYALRGDSVLYQDSAYRPVGRGAALWIGRA